MEPLAVYGTLKKGFRLHHLLMDSPFEGNATLKGFNMYSVGSYPAITRGEGSVEAEVYMVDPHLFRQLDAVEGAYEREKHPTTDGREVWIYVMDRHFDAYHLVKDGVWRQR